jgi:hypothetical protein
MVGKNRYYLIACGTSSYQNYCKDKQLPDVEEEIKKVVNLFTQNFGYTQVLTHLQLNPNASELEEKFSQWLMDNEERSDRDIVIFYYSGHGVWHTDDKHYLLMKDTDPKYLPGKSLPAEYLVRPLNNPEVKIAEILYILDTCHSGHGTSDIIRFVSGVIQRKKPVEGANTAFHAIAVCRAKDIAEVSIFSSALEQVIESCNLNHNYGYIHPADIVKCINQKVSTQIASYNCVEVEGDTQFFPIVPKNLLEWKQKSPEFEEKLLCILSKEQYLEKSLLFINAFILSSIINEEFVLDKQALKEQLRKLAIKPVSEGICPLIACAEWCIEQSKKDENLQNLETEIVIWVHEVMKCRKGLDPSQINPDRESRYNNLQAKIQSGNLRIQIEIEPRRDTKNNTGLPTGLYILNMNLWIESQKFPFGRFAENVVLEPQSDSLEECLSDSLKECLKKADILLKWIRQEFYNSFTESEKTTIEFFLPLSLYQQSLEKICFQSGDFQKELGIEYPIFINSFDRYFNEEFRENRDEIYQKKKELWGNSQNLASAEVYHIGTKPSEKDLEIIEEHKVIAVWSRCPDQPLTEGKEINISDWKIWPEKIHDLRKQNEDLKVTLFWDDLYPKPSRRCRPLNTRVVE